MSPALRTAGGQVLFWLIVIAALYSYGDRAQLILLSGSIAWATRSPYHSVQAMTVVLLATSFNDGSRPIYGEVVEGSPFLTVMRLSVIFVVFIRVVIEWFRKRDGQPDVVIKRGLLLFAVIATGSVISSPMLDVSVFKLALFIIGLFAVSLAVAFAAQDRKNDLFLWFWSWFAAIVIASAPLLALPIGYAVNNLGFQGWLNQPQAAGIMLAPMVLFFGGLGLFDRLWPRLNISLGALGLVEAFATLSRNAILAIAIGIAVGVFVSFLRDPRRWGVATFLGLIGGLFLLLQPATQAGIASLVSKGASQSEFSSESAFERSRGGLVDASLSNFSERPWLGSGFGIASNPQNMVILRDPIIGLPISAPTEKGMIWIALLEEIGVFGFAFFLLLLAHFMRGALKNRTATPIAMATAALMTGNGEAAMVSFGGLGLFVWLILAFANGDGRPQRD